MRIAHIVAAADNGVIGQGGAIPWHVSVDLNRFRALTMGKTIVMGRKTFESLGRALPWAFTCSTPRKGRIVWLSP